ncbi:NtaA/DmoA family FMN-dependent monooxygenase [Rhizobium halophytocola]|uniref:FMN-dependent oxidoreductase (Nitrilotriacetate monooxygenase family) n=1 Tax=Rhizobium halophytocola TaxID=735519 RepID=A0ABS4DV49_9HYPH|nr:NtaA/DmoA family FMN-dependent monooxygenase [Rhizobium halophytocola]MBP1849571.1 FMN-dependent oxidoreductase (nitrilotriacetate monooxygenase family) [Rhizobium halophytocola]
MSVGGKLHIGMSLAPTWLSGEGWRRPDSDVEGIFSADYYVDIARRAEAAHVDFVFRPDTLFLPTAALENGPGFSSLDPTVLLATIARETSHVGLLSTVSTTFLPPYMAARQLQSLHWLSGGRAGWNIVTALDGHENFGLGEMPSAEERYQRAAEFTDVVMKLWASYPQDALKMDRGSGRFADAARVRPIEHQGPHFSVRGPLNLPAQGPTRMPLIQAGASTAGRNFAASVADAVFASTPDRQAAVDLRADLRMRAAAHGRSPDAINLMPGLSLYLAGSKAEAMELFKETHARADRARSLATIREMTGLDLSDWPQDRKVTVGDLPLPPETPRSRTHAQLLQRLIAREALTVGELLWRPEVMGSAHWQVIGTVEDAFEAVRDWTAAGAVDGFVAVPGGSVSSMRLVLERLLPKLADAGLFRKVYAGRTFAGHLAE